MKEHPIFFRTESIRAILEGRKTQTRRVIKPQPDFYGRDVKWLGKLFQHSVGDWKKNILQFCPYGKPGDRLWVKEKHYIEKHRDCVIMEDGTEVFKTGEIISEFCNTKGLKWRSPRFMPRWAARIFLEVTNIRVEKLQDIGKRYHDDILREGWPFPGINTGSPFEDFRIYWNSINTRRGHGWDTNPWVWVIEFRKITNKEVL